MLSFAGAIEQAFRRGLAPCAPTLRAGRLSFALRVQTLSPEDIRKTANEAVARYGDEALPPSRVARLWEERALALGEQPDHENIRIPYLRLGDLTIVSLPFEGYVKTGELARSALRDDKVIALGCAEQLLGYLPTREDIVNVSYGAMESAFLYQRMPPMPGEAERLGAFVGDALRNEEIT